MDEIYTTWHLTQHIKFTLYPDNIYVAHDAHNVGYGTFTIIDDKIQFINIDWTTFYDSDDSDDSADSDYFDDEDYSLNIKSLMNSAFHFTHEMGKITLHHDMRNFTFTS